MISIADLFPRTASWDVPFLLCSSQAGKCAVLCLLISCASSSFSWQWVGIRSGRKRLQLLYHTSHGSLSRLDEEKHSQICKFTTANMKKSNSRFWFEAVYCLFTINKEDKEVLTYIPYLLVNLKCRAYIRPPQVIKNPSTCPILS